MAPRHSIVRKDYIEYGYWLAFDKHGSVSFSRGQPSLASGWRAMHCQTRIPLALFSTPQLSATIDVKADGSSDVQIDVAAAEAALKQVLGVDVVVRHIDETQGG